MLIELQIIWLFTLAIPIACVTWTITHEEIFNEPRDYCKNCSESAKNIFKRKFFYVFTCEYCFSHYITVAFLFLTNFHLLLNDWRGYIIGGFALVWISNVYMSIFVYLRQNIKKEKTEISLLEKVVEK